MSDPNQNSQPNQPPQSPQSPPPPKPQTPTQPTPAPPPPPKPQAVLAPPQSPQPAPDPSTKPQDTRVLLLVEDDPLLINMYQTKFSSEGFQVFTATDGEAGLKLATTEKPNIIILDIMMPKLDGIEVLRRVKQDPKLKNIPILMLSNLSEISKQQQAMKLGAQEFLIKANLTPTQVVDKIKQHLKLA